jgi:hypothetical protein
MSQKINLMKIICPVCNVWLVAVTFHDSSFHFYCVNCNSLIDKQRNLDTGVRQPWLSFANPETASNSFAGLEQF